jgi:hypothetical protein
MWWLGGRGGAREEQGRGVRSGVMTQGGARGRGMRTEVREAQQGYMGVAWYPPSSHKLC